MYLLQELCLENCSLTFLVVFALLVLLQAFYHMLLFRDLFLYANCQTAFDEVPRAVLKVPEPGVYLAALGSSALCGFKHGLGNGLSGFFPELLIF